MLEYRTKMDGPQL